MVIFEPIFFHFQHRPFYTTVPIHIFVKHENTAEYVIIHKKYNLYEENKIYI